MKCKILINFILLILASVYSKAFSQSSEHSGITVSINPMGLLFYGPSLDLGWKMSEKSMIGLDIRRNSWGLLARKFRATDSTLFSFNGMGYAAGFTRFMQNISEGWYLGTLLSLDIQNTKYLENSPFQWHEKTNSLGLLVNAGRRIKLGSQFYFNAGAVIGAAWVRYHWEYDNLVNGFTDPEPRKGNSFFPIGSLELALGFFLL